METYGYEMEELLVVVAALAERYTGHEHSSVTYEKAQMLMEAVLYCIGEYEASLAPDGSEEGEALLIMDKKASAQEAYRRGRDLVYEKVENLRKFYNELILDFQDYGMICLRDTVRKGIPSFFLNYDVMFSPKETLLTLDYPVLKDLRGLSGVDAVWEYVRCIADEQKFLGKFSDSLIRELLRAYHEEYEELVENISSIVQKVMCRRMMQEEENNF